MTEQRFESKPEVGTRVVLRKVKGDLWNGAVDGRSGVVIAQRIDGNALVRFDNRRHDFGPWTSLVPEAQAPAFKVGDRVKCVGTDFSDWRKAKKGGWVGTITGKDEYGWNVRWDNGKGSACLKDDHLVLAPQEPETPTFNPGDMVEIVSHAPSEFSDVFAYKRELPMHTPLKVKEGNDKEGDCWVYTADESEYYFVPAANLRLVPRKQPQPEVIVDGHRYVLAEPERQPQQGEVWRNVHSERLFLFTREGKWVEPASGAVMRVSTEEMIEQGAEYAYATIADAIEAGETFREEEE